MLERPSVIVEGEIEAPRMGADDILLAPTASGVCGGDIKVFKGSDGRRQYPLFMRGHEFAGRVVAAGVNVTGFREGDLVARCFQHYCGWCLNCRLRRSNFCLNTRPVGGGGFAEEATDSAETHGGSLFKVPDGISAAEAALAEPITCAIGAVLKAAPQPGDRVVVIGLGGIGQFLSQILASMHAHVIGVDLQPDKLRSASKVCAEVVNSAEQDVVIEILRLTGGVGADIVMEAVGIPATLRQSLELARMGGRVIIVGAFTQLVDGVNVQKIFRRDLEIKAAKGPSPLLAPDGVPLALRYIEEGIVRPKELLTTFPFSEAQAAFDAQAHGGVIKAVVIQGP
jgi:L-iditol 2-dehydrogenase